MSFSNSVTMLRVSKKSTSETSTPDVVITHSEVNNKGRYEARLGDVQEAGELTYSRTNATTIDASHTFVPETLRGRGIAQILVERLIADAREGNYRVVPSCPYIKSLYKKHPEWSDVMQ